MVQYAKVNAIGAGAETVKAVAGLGNAISSLGDGISKLIGGKGTLDAQIEGMQKLSAAKGIYTERIKYGMIIVIIHEVGHFYFPMIVNSDERQWTWMDEGLNTYLQFITEQEWDRNYPSRRGPPKNIVSYMKGNKNNISPIMTNSESIYQFGNNAYGKPATALNILRETICLLYTSPSPRDS